MIKRCLVLLIALVLLGCEQEQKINAFVKGSFAEIQQQHHGKPYLIMFWSEDCAYCMKELELFGDLLKTQTKFNLITVSTDSFLSEDQIRQKLSSFNLQQAEAWVFAEPIVETLYFDVDKRWHGSLPLTFMFDAQNNKTKKIGIVDKETLTAWLMKND
jgi:thiol-disulfide isomerase/thioredoxin